MKWNVKHRMEYIKTKLAQDGKFNRTDIMAEYKISSAQASIDIKKFIELNPNTIHYDRSAKHYYTKENEDNTANYIIEKLGIKVRYRGESNSKRLESLSTPDGIHAVKQAMVERGYGWEGACDTEFYEYSFWKGDTYNDRIDICDPKESAALLISVYVALKAEEDKANG